METINFTNMLIKRINHDVVKKLLIDVEIEYCRGQIGPQWQE